MHRATSSQLQHAQRLGCIHLTTNLLRSRAISPLIPFALKLHQTHTSERDCRLYSSAVSTNPTSSSALPKRVFWTCRGTWKRAGINTFRCLVGCTLGDFSALWALQTYTPDLGTGSIMALSSKSSHLRPLLHTFPTANLELFSDIGSEHLYYPRNSSFVSGQGQATSQHSLQHGNGHEFHLHASHGTGGKCCGLSSNGWSCSTRRSKVLGRCYAECGCWLSGTITLELLSIEEMGEGMPLKGRLS